MWLNPQKTAHLVTFPEEILNGKLHFLYNEKTCAKASFLIKLQAEACSLTNKETLAQLFSGEFCKISKNIFLTEHLWATCSETWNSCSQNFCFPENVYCSK